MFNFKNVPDELRNRKIEVVKRKPNITIITPYYNAGKTLLQTVNSVLSQTYPYFEWIIVDDGSKDKKSLQALEKIETMDDRIKVFHKENAGPSQARDFGISKASKNSKYIYFLDADDMIDQTMVECLYFALEFHPDASFAYTTMVNFGDAEFIWNKYLTVEQEKKENLICISSMVRKSDLIEVGCFGIKEKSMYEDWNLWLKLIAANKKPLRINAPLFWYRISNSGELSRAKDNHEAAMKYVNETASTINSNVEIIQFPRFNSEDFEEVDLDNILYPQYKKNDKTNLLFLLPWMVIGGADLFNLDILKRIDRKKYNVIVATMLPSNNDLRQEFEKYTDALYDLSSFMDRNKYPIFVEYLIKSRNIDLIFLSNCSYAYAMLPMIKNKFPNLSIIDYVHSIDPKAKRGGFGGYSRDFDKFIDMTYTCNNFTKNQLINDYQKENVETLYIGTDHEKFNPKKFDSKNLKNKFNIPENKIVITYLARFSEEKRPELFVDIAKELLKNNKDLYFVMAGSGDLYDIVKGKILNNGLNKKILLTGATNNPEEIYAISDITVNCSRLEGLALTSFESLSMGVPVVSANVGGQSELIDNTVGRIVPFDQNTNEQDEAMLYVSAINEVISNLNQLKKNARKKITDTFNLNLTVKKFEKIVDHILKEKNVVSNINNDSLIYSLYLYFLYEDYKWLCDQYCINNYGVSVYSNNILDNSFKHRIKKRILDICYKYKIKNEMLVIANFVRNFIQFIKSLIYIFILGIKSILAIIKMVFKIIKNR